MRRFFVRATNPAVKKRTRKRRLRQGANLCVERAWRRQPLSKKSTNAVAAMLCLCCLAGRSNIRQHDDRFHANVSRLSMFFVFGKYVSRAPHVAHVLAQRRHGNLDSEPQEPSESMVRLSTMEKAVVDDTVLEVTILTRGDIVIEGEATCPPNSEKRSSHS